MAPPESWLPPEEGGEVDVVEVCGSLNVVEEVGGEFGLDIREEVAIMEEVDDVEVDETTEIVG